MLRHIVLFKFKPEAGEARVAEIVRDFLGLAEKIDVVRAIEWGINTSGEGLDQGFTHCFLLTFASDAERDAYLPHPGHQAFVERLKPWLERVLVVDYRAATSPIGQSS